VVSSHAPKSMRSQKTDAEQKFEEILQRFEIPLLQYAVRITGDRERARDVVQETFIKFQRNGALDRADEPATWKREAHHVSGRRTDRSARKRAADAFRPTRAKGSDGIFVADRRHTAAAAAGSDSTQIPKRS